MTFRAGQKMVCVDDGPLMDGRAHPFKCGTILVLERVGFCSSNCCGFSFVGVGLLDGRHFYCSERWRPAVEGETDISIFKKMLKPKREKLPA